MESKKSWQSKNKMAKYYEENKPEILARNSEHRKTYNLIEVDCEVCECKVKTCRRSKHMHVENLEVKSWNGFLGWFILKTWFLFFWVKCMSEIYVLYVWWVGVLGDRSYSLDGWNF